MRFILIVYQDFLSGFLVFWQETPGKKQPQGVATPWEFPGEGAFALLEAQKLPTHGILHNARHIKRKTFLGGGLFFL